jgi:hypothetical protein
MESQKNRRKTTGSSRDAVSIVSSRLYSIEIGKNRQKKVPTGNEEHL